MNHDEPEAAEATVKKRRTYGRICPYCSAEFRTASRDRQFCTDEHKAAFHNRSSKVGRTVIPLALAWRAGRNIKGQTPKAKARRASANRAFTEFVLALDAAAKEARETGGVNPVDYLRTRWAAEGSLTPAERSDSYK